MRTRNNPPKPPSTFARLRQLSNRWLPGRRLTRPYLPPDLQSNDSFRRAFTAPTTPEEQLAEYQRILDNCASDDPMTVTQGAVNIPGLPSDEDKEKGIRMALNLDRRRDTGGTPIRAVLTGRRQMDRAQYYAVQAITSISNLETKLQLCKDVFQNGLISRHGLELCKRLFNGLAEKKPFSQEAYQHKLLEFLLADEHLHADRMNGEDAIIAGVILLEGVKSNDERKLLLEIVLNSTPIRNCLIREMQVKQGYQGLLRQVEQWAEEWQVPIPDKWNTFVTEG